MSEGRGKKFLILKYFLMSSNAFGSMIGIFLVLFGISYPREKFPGGYRGQETAAIAGGFIFFSLIGYCGVSRESGVRESERERERTLPTGGGSFNSPTSQLYSSQYFILHYRTSYLEDALHALTIFTLVRIIIMFSKGALE